MGTFKRTPEQKLARNAFERERRKNMTPEEHAAYRAEANARQRRIRSEIAAKPIVKAVRDARRRVVATEWRKNNPDKVKFQKDQDYARHGEHIRARVKKYREDNPDKINASKKQWRDKNPHKLAQWRKNWIKVTNPARYRQLSIEHGNKRRARIKNAAGTCTYRQFLDRVDYFGWRCRYCDNALTDKTVTMDHQTPLTRGGSHWPSNLVPACFRCNNIKRDMTRAEFLGHHRFSGRTLITNEYSATAKPSGIQPSSIPVSDVAVQPLA